VLTLAQDLYALVFAALIREVNGFWSPTFGTTRHGFIGRLIGNHPIPFFSENDWNREIKWSEIVCSSVPRLRQKLSLVHSVFCGFGHFFPGPGEKKRPATSRRRLGCSGSIAARVLESILA
jgi:hypothetical protein